MIKSLGVKSVRMDDVATSLGMSKRTLYEMFGDKEEIEAHLSKYLQEIRDSAKAEGQDRIFIHGEKEAEAHQRVLREGVYLNDKTYEEMRMIGEFTGAGDLLPEYLD